MNPLLAEVSLSKHSSIQEIIERGKLIVGVCRIDQPPFYERDKNNALHGIDIDIARGIAKDLGVQLEINQHAANWDDLVTQLQKGTIDLAISFLSKTSNRAQSIIYSRTYVKGNQSILLNRLRLNQAKSRGLKTLKQIFSKDSGETLLTYEGSAYIKFAKILFPEVHLITFKTAGELYEALLKGEYIGLITDQLEVKSYLEKKPDQKLILLPVAIKDHYDLIAIGGSNTDQTLIDYVNTYLEVNNIDIDINSLDLLKDQDQPS